MRKNLYYKDLTPKEAFDFEKILSEEINLLPMDHKVRSLFREALIDYKAGLWAYDGPTFSKSYKNVWEIPAFIHDWRNSMGYLSYAVDEEMFSLMILLNYPMEYISQRWILTRFTFLNIFIKYVQHKIKKLDKTKLYLL